MANPLYQQIMGMNQAGASHSGAPQFSNPVQKMQYILQAMTNPVAFVRNAFPDIPTEIQNSPGQILQYLQKTRGVTDGQIQQAQQMAGQIIGQGTVK